MTNQIDAEKRHLKMFGCSKAELDAILDNPITKLAGPEMLAMSILSDAQELLAQDAEQNAEIVRQFMNRAKLVLDGMLRAKSGPTQGSGLAGAAGRRAAENAVFLLKAKGLGWTPEAAALQAALDNAPAASPKACPNCGTGLCDDCASGTEAR